MRTLTSVGAALAAVAVLAAGQASAVAHADDPAPTSGVHPRLTTGDLRTLAELRQSLGTYRDPAVAVRDGWIPSETCTALPDGSAGMGYHYLNPALQSAPPDPLHPSVLVYVPTADGGLTLGAAEWFQADADQDLSTDPDRPSLFGIPFDGPMSGHEPGMPVHYDLHAWLFTPNPAGLFEPWNPRVTC